MGCTLQKGAAPKEGVMDIMKYKEMNFHIIRHKNGSYEIGYAETHNNICDYIYFSPILKDVAFVGKWIAQHLADLES